MRRLAPLLLLVLSTLCTVAVFEGVVRLFIGPCDVAWGTLGSRELPPRRLVPHPRSPDFDPDLPVPQRTSQNEPLTQGDLNGIFQEDALIGYVWSPSRTSRRGWWRSNALGARAEGETPKDVPPGKRRVLVFGDSFAAGTRLPGPVTWPAQLGRLRPDLDVVNFGVDGYGMGQSYLLFRRVREKVDWDAALFLFVPWHDSWRDVNVSRWAGDRWSAYTPMPRFVLAGQDVRLVPPPYARGTEVYTRDFPEASPALRDHLRAYDRLYDPLLFESPPVVGHLVSWKLAALWMAERRREARRREILEDLEGEAFTVCTRVLVRAQREARQRGKGFVVGLLPAEDEVRAMRGSADARARWRRVADHLREAGLEVVDVAPALVSAPADALDPGADGSHYGPRASARIASAIQGFRFASRKDQISRRDSSASGVSVRLKLCPPGASS